MHPIAVLYDTSTEGYPTRLTIVGESGRLCPPEGSYDAFPTSILELPRDKKAVQIMFQFNNQGWIGLKVVYNRDQDCIISLPGRSTPDSVEKELVLAQNEEIFAIKMAVEDNYVKAVHLILCHDFGKKINKPTINV